jgi:hypothetical protein
VETQVNIQNANINVNGGSNCYLFREQYQGIKSPVTRTENDFDPGAKYHIPANVIEIDFNWLIN